MLAFIRNGLHIEDLIDMSIKNVWTTKTKVNTSPDEYTINNNSQTIVKNVIQKGYEHSKDIIPGVDRHQKKSDLWVMKKN
uniref:Transposase n=1 Tax=Caenorhabditis tropicalis TaxID=1561998 RepID=A0A1I7TW53_9PELO